MNDYFKLMVKIQQKNIGNKEKGQNLLLIEILEDDLVKINIPFVVYASIGKDGDKKLKSLYARLNETRKQMADVYQEIDQYYRKNYNDKSN